MPPWWPWPLPAGAGHARSHDVRLEAYSIRFLKFSDVFHDCSQFGVGDPRDRRHVSEGPVMSPNAVPGSKEERLVWMMSGVVDVIDEGWSEVRPVSLGAVAPGAVALKQGLAGARQRRQRRGLDNGGAYPRPASKHVVGDNPHTADDNESDRDLAD